jgi:alkanesulfonate monooxygenase SsuD/methylene tetrahydromethanopterin reductase-like flavin-dependent oxidoreductase (luciferase family)
MQPVAVILAIPVVAFEATYNLAIDRFVRILMLWVGQPVAHQGPNVAQRYAHAGDSRMDFGIFNLMGYREPDKTTAQVLKEATEQTCVAEELGFGMSWFAEHHFSNYAICPSPLMMVAHCAPITNRIRLGTGVLVLPLYNPARLTAEIAMADALCDGRLVLGVGSGYQPYEFERFCLNLNDSKGMFSEFLDIIELGLSRDFFSYDGTHVE